MKRKKKLTKKQIDKLCEEYNLIRLENIVPYFEEQYQVALGRENQRLSELKEKFYRLHCQYDNVEEKLRQLFEIVRLNKPLCTATVKMSGANIGEIKI